ncbi:MAG: 3-hydroxybutyrate oligomer hydrolase family protein [Thermomonas sp.]|uniref:3-hydroxybutyrate oligomer hydrolase family protein n=1 Tax=Thermomonas sp. TaxID=1971895 RepID=UPI0039E46F69
MNRPRHYACAVAIVLLAACASTPSSNREASMFSQQRATDHRDGDDLLTAGLGLAGLRAMVPPAFADSAKPTPAELRRRALWSSWRGIADLAPGGGYGDLYGSTANVPGREFSAFATLPGAHQPHRVLLQLPDAFDANKRCVVVTASSGSRGVYGAIAVAGAWGLPRGCAVVHTDKGTGSDYYDLDAGQGIAADGTVAGADAALAFKPVPASGHGVAWKHAHSQDNPEADWGRHLKQAAQFALATLNEQLPQQAPFTFDNTRIIAVGVSNAGGAVLRAAEDAEPWLDAVVAGEPNVLVEGHGTRSLLDYGTEAALLMPCALPALGIPAAPGADAKCAALAAQGVLAGADLKAQQQDALAKLSASGWTHGAMQAGSISVAFDLWRAVAVGYASAYGRYPHDAHPCGYRYSALGADLSPRAATNNERAAWWADASGIPPGAGVGIIDPQPAADLGLTGLQCLRALWMGDGEDARRVRKGAQETRAGLPRAGLPVVVIHGTDDGLVPQAFTSAPYVIMANSAGRDVRYWQVRNAQHFDAFLGFPQYGAVWLPLLPYVYEALDRVDAHLDGKGALPASAVIKTVPRAGKPLEAAHLAMPR